MQKCQENARTGPVLNHIWSVYAGSVQMYKCQNLKSQVRRCFKKVPHRKLPVLDSHVTLFLLTIILPGASNSIEVT